MNSLEKSLNMAIVSGYGQGLISQAPYLICGDKQSMDRSDDSNDSLADPVTVRTVIPVAPLAVVAPPSYARPPPRPLMPLAYRRPPVTAVVPLIPLVPMPPYPSFEMPPHAPMSMPPHPPLLMPPHPPLLMPQHPPLLMPPHPPLLMPPHPLPPAEYRPPLSVPSPSLVAPGATPASSAPDVLASVKRFARTALTFAAYAVAGYLALVAVLMIAYRFVNPPMSSLMLQQRLTGQEITQDWVAIDAISPQIVRAVVVAEDGRFCQHRGIDMLAMQAAIEQAKDGVARGASTISMQVTKNLFLWPSKSYIRKALEIPLTLAMELLWPKRRIMEVYLNIAEWGPGIFGVEAASRYHFDKAASRLNEREAARLAAALPNPFFRDPGEPGPRTKRLAGDIQGRMRGASPSQTGCVLRPRKAG
jgi:monofunctional biosynthetic peptidoglycan transglycosylase